ncbi:sialin [Trichonephila clavipes]|nr:sialin [Trichonephila clavipes]
MSSFFYAYFVTVLTGGYIAKKFGAKRVFGGGVLLTSVLTLLTPAAVRWGTIPFIVARALEGIEQWFRTRDLRVRCLVTYPLDKNYDLCPMESSIASSK